MLPVVTLRAGGPIGKIRLVASLSDVIFISPNVKAERVGVPGHFLEPASGYAECGSYQHGIAIHLPFRSGHPGLVVVKAEVVEGGYQNRRECSSSAKGLPQRATILAENHRTGCDGSENTGGTTEYGLVGLREEAPAFIASSRARNSAALATALGYSTGVPKLKIKMFRARVSSSPWSSASRRMVAAD